jgi:hypothetical protein
MIASRNETAKSWNWTRLSRNVAKLDPRKAQIVEFRFFAG